MYDQLCPPQSLHLATTFNAIGFLSRKPLDRLPGLHDYVELEREKMHPPHHAALAEHGGADAATTKAKAKSTTKGKKPPPASRADFWLRHEDNTEHWVEVKTA